MHKDLLQKNTMSRTLLDEYNNTFSSNKTPMNPNARTVASISMDIINQRVENINKNYSMNRSVSEANISYDKIEESLKVMKTPVTIHSSSSPFLCNIGTQIHSEKSQPIVEETPIVLTVQTPAATVKKPMKRKLFAPPSMFSNDLLATPRTDKAVDDVSDLNIAANGKVTESGTKRGREEDDILSLLNKPNEKRAKKNRLVDAAAAIIANGNRTPARRVTTATAKSSRRSSAFFQSAKKPTQNGRLNSSTAVESKTTTNTPKSVLVFTNMHQPQIDFIKEVGQKI